ncbi:hypothetical protein SAMD00019534_031660 [Acytostelium subglobosum LB1]|uniref:hypothetical protein n=1 Tax=Acytostelium subglobosum LB1 TaxID=1410327 RepID=UPI000644C34D|nr:hypothetical protein SAMD00019534_031660 [Acytostelium subglobosum LB1]GAM19991.1 hypothetical protein SAMD00019534_031660 [Acytostelium subglobosum LB1]|eukprot:XP_012756753.1 hypothetical protein SAMD00019534_031660 [Acytostelium subglobosum LB1]
MTDTLVGTGNDYGYSYDQDTQVRMVGKDNILYGMGKDANLTIAMLKYNYKQQELIYKPLHTEMPGFYECFYDPDSNIFYLLYFNVKEALAWSLQPNLYFTVYQSTPYVGFGNWHTVTKDCQYLFKIDLKDNLANVIFSKPGLYVLTGGTGLGFVLDAINGYMLAVLTNTPYTEGNAYFWMINLNTLEIITYPKPYPMPGMNYAFYYLE